MDEVNTIAEPKHDDAPLWERATRPLLPRDGGNPFDIGPNPLNERIAQTGGMGIRAAVRIPLVIVVVIAFLVLSAISYSNITSDELTRASNSIQSEVNYLCLQMEALDERAQAFARVLHDSDELSDELIHSSLDDCLMRVDPIGAILQGYTHEETGTVCITSGEYVVATADERLPVATDLKEALGSAYAAIQTSMDTGEVQPIALEGALAEPGGSKDGYLLAGKQGDYTVVIVQPSSMVFRERTDAMIREATMTLLILGAVFVILDRLLVYIVARRIEKMNDALQRITSGDLDARAEEAGTREFKSLAQGINVTVDALKGWIAEAESRMDAELATAKAIQESALPREFPPFPDIPRFEIFASIDPARKVGGDFYDFFLVGDSCTPESGKLGFVVADVSGKGVPAALFMMKAKALIRDYVNAGFRLGKAVAEANRSICNGNDTGMFATAWIGVLDYATGRVEYVNAGHNPPLLWKRDAGWQWLDEKSGLPLGLFELGYEAFSIDCEAGDELLLYTDGVTEAYSADEVLYGEDRLLALVEKSGKLPPQELQRLVREDVAAHAEGAEQSDDITIMVLEVGGASE